MTPFTYEQFRDWALRWSMCELPFHVCDAEPVPVPVHLDFVRERVLRGVGGKHE